jgi:hypothetical protein
MSKRSIRGASSNAAHKRQAMAPTDEGPLPSSSSSLAHQPSSLSIPTMPLHLTADLILPFVADRSTWNSACSASIDLRLAGKKMTPPWPHKSFNLGSNAHVRNLVFCSIRITAGVLCQQPQRTRSMRRSCLGSMGQGNVPRRQHRTRALH